nr:hypothetical protein [Tanacetum cinerariifolium]
MILIRILLIGLPILTTLHTPYTRLARVIHMEMILILVMIVRLSYHLIMSRNQATLKTTIRIHMIHRVFHNNIFVVKTAGCPVIHQAPQEISIQEMEDLKQQYLDEMKRLINSEHHDEIKIDELKGNFNRMNYTVVITADFLITDSLIMENEHLDTISETKSDKFIKSSVENLVLIPSESEDFSDIESKCDMPDCDDSQTKKISTFSNPLFDDSTSSDDESSHEEKPTFPLLLVLSVLL